MILVLLAYGLSKEIVTSILMLYKKTKLIIHLHDSEMDFFCNGNNNFSFIYGTNITI